LPGIFVVGDVTGTPLVKVAANQGAAVIATMNASGEFRRPAAEANGPLDVVIIGGGPAGLSAAIESQKIGLRYVVLERAKLASTVRGFPPGKKVYAEPRSLANASVLETGTDLERDEFVAMVERLVADRQLHVQEDTEVKRVRQTGEHQFAVETASGHHFPTRNVVVAIGRQGQPRLLECPGAELAHKVTYRLHNPEDYRGKDILVVGGGNSAIEAALLLAEDNRVTLSYRGTDLFRAKEENRRLIDEAVAAGRVRIVYGSEVAEVREAEVSLALSGDRKVIPNDHVIVLIGTLPPVDFLLDMGLELDGVWTRKRLGWAVVGLLLGLVVYFLAKFVVLRPEDAGGGKILVPGVTQSFGAWLDSASRTVLGYVMPILFLVNFALWMVNVSIRLADRRPFVPTDHSVRGMVTSGLLFSVYHVVANLFTTTPELAGAGPYYLPGFAWVYRVVPAFFSNLSGLYYLLYFSAIAGFGVYWAVKARHRIVWRRNLTIIAVQWTLWWGIPTALVVLLGRNPWTPLLSRSLNAWPLNIGAFTLDPAVGPGDPEWWHTVAVVGVAWAVFLTFVVIPLVTVRWGKLYCSYVCSCGALAETVGNGFRHRGPKGDGPRKWERAGFVFIVLAAVGTAVDLYGFKGPLGLYNVWVGTFLAGAVAIGLYPFLGQRVWCRMWCPLAFWMNFWGRWSRFKITAEKGKCIDCNVCNQYCQMGIDIKSRALRGQDVTLADTPCVGCGECVVRCPMKILHLGEAPAPLLQLGTERLSLPKVGTPGGSRHP
jgi:thioredoxin reductase/Pyruvate/2-oxoacid:ferredoxin oxidoreductase delta subunit